MARTATISPAPSSVPAVAPTPRAGANDVR
jgi:hypothetical protein